MEARHPNAVPRIFILYRSAVSLEQPLWAVQVTRTLVTCTGIDSVGKTKTKKRQKKVEKNAPGTEYSLKKLRHSQSSMGVKTPTLGPVIL